MKLAIARIIYYGGIVGAVLFCLAVVFMCAMILIENPRAMVGLFLIAVILAVFTLLSSWAESVIRGEKK